MTKEQLIRAFVATVDASVHGLHSLADVLQQEASVLVGKDPEVLEQVVKQKIDLLRQLEYSVQARDRLQQESGFDQGLAGGRQLVDLLDDAEISQRWTELMELSHAVSERNDRNGQLVVQQQRAARSALEILTGRPHREDTYRALRRRNGTTPRHTLGRS